MHQAVSGASPASRISWSVGQNGNNLAIAPPADFAGKAQGNVTDTELNAALSCPVFDGDTANLRQTSSGSNNSVWFAENGSDGISFTSKAALPDRLLKLGAGLQIFSKNKYEVRAEYLAQMGKHFTNQELSLRMAYSF